MRGGELFKKIAQRTEHFTERGNTIYCFFSKYICTLEIACFSNPCFSHSVF